MWRSVIASSLRYRHLVLAFALVALVVGSYTVRNIHLDVLPEFDPPMVEVQAEALGLSAAEVEELVTINLEEILTAAPYLQSIHSKSVPGLASVLLTFEPGTDVMRARQMVQERLTMAWALPNVSKPPVMLQPRSAASRAMIIGLSSKQVSLIDMSVLARWTMTPKLLGVPGVANVAIWGQRARQLQVQVDTRNLQARGVTLNQVITSTGESLWVSPLTYLESSVLGASGWIDTPNQRLGIQHVQPIKKADELSRVAIADSKLTLGDVATVVEQHPPLIGDAIIAGEPGIMLVIEKLPGTDVRAVVDGVEQAMAELLPGMSGIDVNTQVYKSTRYVDAALSNLGSALSLGAGLMVVVMFLSFMAFRPALLAIFAFSLSFVAALLVLYFRGSTVNIISLVGLAAALTAVTDTAVLAVSAIVRRQREGSGSQSLAEVIFGALSEIRHPVIYGTLVGILTIVPIFALPGLQGAFFGPLAQSYVLALVAAMTVAVVVVPGAALLLREEAVAEEAAGTRLPVAAYQRVLSRFSVTVRPAYAVVGFLVLVLAISVPMLKWSPAPSFNERDTVVSWEAAPGTSLQAMNRLMKELSAALQTIPGVRSASGHIGRAITGDQIVGIESGQIWVSVDDTADYEETMSAIREMVRGFPAINARVQSYLTGAAQRVAANEGDPIVVRIEGAESNILSEQAQRIAKMFSGIKDVGEVRIDKQSIAPEIDIKVNVEAAAKLGIKPGDVRRTAATIFSGLVVGNLFEDQKVFDVIVWGAPAIRQSITDIENLLIDGPGGTHVRLGDVAEVNLTTTPNMIDRDGVTRSIDVHAGVKSGNAAAVAGDVEAELSKLEFPFEYHAYLLDDYSKGISDKRTLILITVAVTVLAFVLLQAAVQSWRLAFALCLALMASLSGGTAMILASGGTVALGSLAGLLAVFGFALRASLATVNRMHETSISSGNAPGSDTVIRVAGERLMPILTTAAVSAVVVAPIAFIGNDAGLEILGSMAGVLVGGLCSAVAVNLFVVPAFLRHLAISQKTFELGRKEYALS